MNLFQVDKFSKVTWDPQALLIAPFKVLYDRDKTKTKDIANKELAFIFFFSDIRSDYAFIVDLAIREKTIKADLVLGEKWKIDKDITAAIEYYKKRSRSVTADILTDSIYIANKVSIKMKEAVDAEGTIDLADIAKVLDGIKKIPDVIKALKAAEREVIKEIEEAQDSIGAKEKALFEDLQLHGDISGT